VAICVHAHSHCLLTTTQAATMENFLAQTGVGQREDEEEEEEENGLNSDNNGSLTIFAMDFVFG